MVVENVVPGYTASMSVRVLAVPYDSGNRAVRMGAGPDRLLEHGLAHALCSAGYDLDVEHVEVGGGIFEPKLQPRSISIGASRTAPGQRLMPGPTHSF